MNNWIALEDSMPGIDYNSPSCSITILVCVKSNDPRIRKVTMGWIDYASGIFKDMTRDDEEMEIDEISYWMPLPDTKCLLKGGVK